MWHGKNGAPNKSLQRTRAAGVARGSSPLSSRPLGRRRNIGLLVALCGSFVTAVLGAPSFFPAVRGVSLRAHRSQVIKALGNPSRTEVGPDTEMGQGEFQHLFYAGLTVELRKLHGQEFNKASREFHVWKMILTEKKWEVSPGVRVGMTREQVEAVLGTPESTESFPGDETLSYSPFTFDAYFWVTLKGGVVVEIVMAEDYSRVMAAAEDRRRVMAASLPASLLNLASSPNPSHTNSSFTLTASVSGSGPTPTGTVEFDWRCNCGMPTWGPGPRVELDSTGRATMHHLGFSGPGSQHFDATYAGDINYGPSHGSVTQVVTGPVPMPPPKLLLRALVFFGPLLTASGVLPVAAWSAVICLALLLLLGISSPGKRMIREASKARAPLGLLCFLVSLIPVLLGTVILIANMEVRNWSRLVVIAVAVLLPGNYAADWFLPETVGWPFVLGGLTFTFVLGVSSVIWTAVLYAAMRLISRGSSDAPA